MADPLENESAETLLSMKNGAVNFKSDSKLKKENTNQKMDVDEEEIPVLNPASLGLKRVGDDDPPTPKKTPKLRKQMPPTNKSDNKTEKSINKPDKSDNKPDKSDNKQDKLEKDEKLEKQDKEKINRPNLRQDRSEKANPKQEKNEKSNLKEKTEKSTSKDKEKTDKTTVKEKTEKPTPKERTEKTPLKEKTEKPTPKEKTEKVIPKEKTEKTPLKEKTEKPTPKEKTEKLIKQEKLEKPTIKQEKIEKQTIKQEKSDKGPSSSSTESSISKKTKSKNALSMNEKTSPVASTPEQPLLNRRGMPARVRKKNRLFFDDDVIIETPFKAWPKKTTTKTPTPTKRLANIDTPSTSKEKEEKKEKSLDNTSSGKRANSPASVTRSQTSSSSSTNSVPSPATRRSQMTREERMKERAEREKDISSDIKSIPSSPSPSTPSEKKPIIKEIKKEVKIKTEKEDSKESKDDWSLMAPLSSPDRRAGQRIGMRLRNLLKLPKAHKWVCYEWFYSNIDKALFDGDNDFINCLKESFPQLKTRTLTRVEWCKIRRMMGKPRRCSVAFFEEERRELERKRCKIRLLQQRKTSDVSNCKDLPGEIPLQLVIGTKVTARLRKPQDGLFTGSIDAVDTSNNTYRITFERQGLGTYSVPDYEVLSNEPPEMITLSSFAQKFRPRPVVPPYMIANASGGFRTGLITGPNLNEQNRLNLDPLLNLTPLLSGTSVDGQLGPFPVKFLEKIVRLNKILKEKREILNNLREMNCEAEKSNSFGWPISDDFKQRYALVVINLDELNRDMFTLLETIHKYCDEIEPESDLRQMLSTNHLREKSMDEARQVVTQVNNEADFQIADERMLQLITQLTSLMIQVQNLSTEDRNTFEVQVLEESLSEIQRGLHPDNLQCFQDCVEVHVQHIQQSLGLGALNPFGTHRP